MVNYRRRFWNLKRTYECLLAIDTAIQPSEADALLEKVKRTIEEAEGAVRNIEKVGIRRLAFRVHGKTDAFFVKMLFESPVGAVKTLEGVLRLNENILRFMTTRYDSAPKAEESAGAPQASPEKAA